MLRLAAAITGWMVAARCRTFRITGALDAKSRNRKLQSTPRKDNPRMYLRMTASATGTSFSFVMLLSIKRFHAFRGNLFSFKRKENK